jgi:translocation and assembly module TamA
VNTDTRSADVHLAWSAGTRYRLGTTRFDPDAQFSSQFLQGYVPWKSGDYYSTDELLTLQNRL